MQKEDWAVSFVSSDSISQCDVCGKSDHEEKNVEPPIKPFEESIGEPQKLYGFYGAEFHIQNIQKSEKSLQDGSEYSGKIIRVCKSCLAHGAYISWTKDEKIQKALPLEYIFDSKPRPSWMQKEVKDV